MGLQSDLAIEVDTDSPARMIVGERDMGEAARDDGCRRYESGSGESALISVDVEDETDFVFAVYIRYRRRRSG